MPRKRGKAKRSYGIKRAKKHRIKTDPRLISLRFKERIDPMSTNISYWLPLLDQLEKEILPLLIKYGIPSEEFISYLAYSKSLFSKVSRFKAVTLFNEILNWIAIFVTRGLKRDVLESLIDPITSVWEEQFVVDYLRYFIAVEVITPEIPPIIKQDLTCAPPQKYLLNLPTGLGKPPIPTTAYIIEKFKYTIATALYPITIPEYETACTVIEKETYEITTEVVTPLPLEFKTGVTTNYKVGEIVTINPTVPLPSYPLGIFEHRPFQQQLVIVTVFTPVPPVAIPVEFFVKPPQKETSDYTIYTPPAIPPVPEQGTIYKRPIGCLVSCYVKP